MARKKRPEVLLSDREKWLVALLGTGRSAACRQIDPVRIMKALFLFSQRTPAGWLPQDARYEFQAYSYGPCSFAVYTDLERLQQLGLVEATSSPFRSWSVYSVSPDGRAAFAQARGQLDPRALRYLAQLKDFACSLSFRDLLKVVYKAYPEYAEKSVFKGKAGN